MARFRRAAIAGAVIGLALACLPASKLMVTEAGSKVGKLPKDSVAQRQLRLMDGSQFSLAGARGRVVVLSFFAVWCGHSRDQIPPLTKLSEAESGRGLQVVGLAVEDAQTTTDRINNFIKDQKINFPVGVVSDPVFAGYIESRVVDVPQTLVYGRDGRLAAHYIGQSAANDAALADVVKRELDKK